MTLPVVAKYALVVIGATTYMVVVTRFKLSSDAVNGALGFGNGLAGAFALYCHRPGSPNAGMEGKP